MERASRYPNQCDAYDWVDQKLATYERLEGKNKSPKCVCFGTTNLPAEISEQRAAELLQCRYEMLYQRESTAALEGKVIKFQAQPLPTIQCPVICPREQLPAYYAMVRRLFQETVAGDGIRSPWGLRSQFRLNDIQEMGFLMSRTHLFLGSPAPNTLTIDRELPLKDVAMTLLRLLYDLAPQEKTIKEERIELSIPLPITPWEREEILTTGKESLRFALDQEFPDLWDHIRKRDSDDSRTLLSVTLTSSSVSKWQLTVPVHYAAAARKALRNLSTLSAPHYRVPKNLSGRLLTLSIISLLPEEGMKVIYDPIAHTVTRVKQK